MLDLTTNFNVLFITKKQNEKNFKISKNPLTANLKYNYTNGKSKKKRVGLAKNKQN